MGRCGGYADALFLVEGPACWADVRDCRMIANLHIHLMNRVSVLASMTPASAAKTVFSTSSSAFLFLTVVVAVSYFLFIRPGHNRRMASMRACRAFDSVTRS